MVTNNNKKGINFIALCPTHPLTSTAAANCAENKGKHSRKLTSRKVLLQLKEHRKGLYCMPNNVSGRVKKMLFPCLLLHLIVRLTYIRMIIVTFLLFLNKTLCSLAAFYAAKSFIDALVKKELFFRGRKLTFKSFIAATLASMFPPVISML